MKKGKFIVFEGCEGSGKTTIINMLSTYLALNDQAGKTVFTREPGGTKISEQIREVILSKDNTEMDPTVEALLYVAARMQHVTEKIIPELEKGNTVICDRFIDSSIAYQGFARGLGIEKIQDLNQPILEMCNPDLVIFLDCSPEKGLGRIEKSLVREVNRLDKEDLEFHEKVREGYLMAIKGKPGVIINADQSIEAVFNDVLSALKTIGIE